MRKILTEEAQKEVVKTEKEMGVVALMKIFNFMKYLFRFYSDTAY